MDNIQDSQPVEEKKASHSTEARARKAALLGAVFLMATSAIGPGFLTQTATFTAKLGAAFAFAILISVLLDIAIQLNVWRVIAVSGRRAQELGNAVLPGLGWFMSILVVVGGVVFNIGNVGGAGLGANAMLGIDAKIGGIVTAIVAIGFFLSRRAGMALDKALVVLGAVMILVTAIVAFSSNPPVGEALKNTVMPGTIDLLAIITLVGGTVGGYITYAGAHRMLDSGAGGVEHLAQTTRSSVTSIIVTAVMRFLLFLAVLGVVAGGVVLNTEGNPAAEAFQAAAGDLGMRFFGVVLWAAGISSIVGASYTSATFLTRSSGSDNKTQNTVTIVLIAISTLLFGIIGTAPATLLVFAGAFNGLVLPIGVTVLLYIALFRSDLMNGYKYPKWLAAIGILGVAVAWFLAWRSFGGVFQMLG
ncbi:membrane protein [Corynebacterium lactis RW2-5]|uniref:Membrane protein n=2 Tax=Corynebacterium lactis TaxID=1231000 RepID=A0A0K2GYZ4_9CORY|nr:membrane protein [Corynebacterium lactis RW2-5]